MTNQIQAQAWCSFGTQLPSLPCPSPPGPLPPQCGQDQSCRQGTAHLAEAGSGLLEPSDLQPLLEEVQGIRQGLANDSGSTATEQVFEVP